MQAAVNYANRQLQQKIKTQMLAKMEKLTGKPALKRSNSAKGRELTIDDESDEEESGLQKVIDEIWVKYDEDNSGSLDIDEARLFVKDILSDLGGSGDNEFSEPVFQALFETFDEDKSGTLEKDEILTFITKLIYEDN